MDKRDLIYKNAIKVISEKEFYNTTIKDIVTTSGVAVGTFYNYFNDKNDLLIYIFSKEFENIYDNLNYIYSLQLSPPEKLKRFIDFMFDRIDYARDNCKAVSASFNSIHTLAKALDISITTAEISNVSNIFEKLISDGQSSYYFKSGESLTIFNVILVMAYSSYEDYPNKPSINETKSFIYNSILNQKEESI